MNWLITGGAGYIGSHIAELFQQEGLSYYCYDNLSTGDPARISDHERLIVGDIHDELKLSSLIKELNISGVIHLAAKKSVEESREKPILYEETNFVKKPTSSLIFPISATSVAGSPSRLGRNSGSKGNPILE